MTNQLTLSPIKQLYKEARVAGMEYIFTLLRVEYYSIKIMDPLLLLRAELEAAGTEQTQQDELSLYGSLIQQDTPLDLLANLFNCVRNLQYNVSPFYRLGQENGIFVRKPTLDEKLAELNRMALAALRPQVGALIA